MDSLNQLGSTPWKVNERVLDVAIDVFNHQDKHEEWLNVLAIPRHEDMIEEPTVSEEMQVWSYFFREKKNNQTALRV